MRREKEDIELEGQKLETQCRSGADLINVYTFLCDNASRERRHSDRLSTCYASANYAMASFLRTTKSDCAVKPT